MISVFFLACRDCSPSSPSCFGSSLMLPQKLKKKKIINHQKLLVVTGAGIRLVQAGAPSSEVDFLRYNIFYSPHCVMCDDILKHAL